MMRIIMHMLHQLFPPDFWTREAVDLRDTLIEVLRVLAIYIVGRFLINRAAKSIALAAAAGTRRLNVHSPLVREARLQTLVALIRSIGLYVLFFVCSILLLRALNFDAISVVTSASVAGIAFGLGAQKLFRDVVSGFFIILEDQYAIGDYVTINNIVTGKVEEMGMRILKVRDDGGRLVIFANGDITQVTNQSRGAVSSVVEMGIPPGSDLAKVRALVDEAGSELFNGRKEELGFAKAPALQGVAGGDSTRSVIRIIVELDDPAQLAVAGIALRDAVYARLLAAGVTPL